MKLTITTILLLMHFSAFALEVKPYPKAKISIKEWKSYYYEVKESIGETEKIAAEHRLVTYVDRIKNAHFAFTQEHHPAHPSWVTRIIVEHSGGLSVQQLGYFAGNEQEFAKLFAQYQEVNKNMKQWVNEQRAKNK